MSLWKGIDRNKFEQNLSILTGINKYQPPETLPAIEANGLDSEGQKLALPVETEKHLADSLAFLAATSAQPKHVSAAAVKQCGEQCHVTIVIAANQGVEKITEPALRAMIESFASLSRRAIGTAETERICREQVLVSHRARILARLGSMKAGCQQRFSIDLACRLRSLIDTWDRSTNGRTDWKDILTSLVDSIDVAIQSESRSKRETDALRNVLQLSFQLMCEPGRPSELLARESRELRELRALAMYWKICNFLVSTAKKHRKCFQSVQLMILPAPPRAISHGVERYIHAEVQILGYLAHSVESTCRYIGSSKKPCFLCYCMVRAYSKLALASSHGEIYDLWTVPEGQKYNKKAWKALNRALKIVDRDVARVVNLSNATSAKIMHPSQTMSKLLLDHCSSSPASTVVAVAIAKQTLRSALSRLSILETEQSAEPPVDARVGELEAGRERIDGHAMPSDAARQRRVQSDSFKSLDYARTDGLEVFLEINYGTPSSHRRSASISIRRTTTMEQLHEHVCFRSDELEEGAEHDVETTPSGAVSIVIQLEETSWLLVLQCH